MKKYWQSIVLYSIIIIIIFGAISLRNGQYTQNSAADYTYSDLIRKLENDEVKQIEINNSSDIFNYGTAKATLTDGKVINVNIPSVSTLTDWLQNETGNKDVKIITPDIPKTGILMAILPSIVLMILAVILFTFMFQRMQGGGGGGKMMSFGKSKAKVTIDDKNKVTFANVAGLDEEKAELEELVEFLKEPKKFVMLGARIPKGVLLVGPPGTGKTLLAKAVAGEAGVPFFSISGSDFVEMFVGVGASRVRDLFEQAKKSAPCIIFIDEIDAVGRHRGAGLGGGHDEREQTLNQLLVEMDGFSANEGIIIVAATNRPDILDPALLRPGRFDRQIVVDKPDVKGRAEILKVHSKGKPLAEDVDLDVLARRTAGFTGADLSNLVNEAALLSARRNGKTIGMNELEDSIERVIAGPERKSRVISDNERKLTAYHEAGHTVIGMLLENTDPVHKVSIIPRGRAGGYTLMLPKEDRYYATRSELRDQLKALLGGRVAEAVVLKEISTGAQNDLERVTALARKMICEYGMSEKLGSMTFGKRQETVFLGRDFGRDKDYSEEVAFAIDEEVRSLVDEAYKVTEQLITANLDKLHALAAALLEKETLEAPEIAALMNGEKIDLSKKVTPPQDVPVPIDLQKTTEETTAKVITAQETFQELRDSDKQAESV